MPDNIQYEGMPGVRIDLEDGSIIDAGRLDLFLSGPPGEAGNLTRPDHNQIRFSRLSVDVQRALRDALTRAVLARDPTSVRDQAILAIQEALPRA